LPAIDHEFDWPLLPAPLVVSGVEPFGTPIEPPPAPAWLPALPPAPARTAWLWPSGAKDAAKLKPAMVGVK